MFEGESEEVRSLRVSAVESASASDRDDAFAAYRAEDEAREAARHAQTLWHDLATGNAHIVDRFRLDRRSFLVASRRAPAAAKRAALSERELLVAAAAASGSALKTIGFDLGVTPSTVCHYLRSILRKTGVASRQELAFWFGSGAVAAAGGVSTSEGGKHHG